MATASAENQFVDLRNKPDGPEKFVELLRAKHVEPALASTQEYFEENKDKVLLAYPYYLIKNRIIMWPITSTW